MTDINQIIKLIMSATTSRILLLWFCGLTWIIAFQIEAVLLALF